MVKAIYNTIVTSVSLQNKCYMLEETLNLKSKMKRTHVRIKLTLILNTSNARTLTQIHSPQRERRRPRQ